MRNLKQFETTAEYNSAESSLILPNVSVCKDAPTVVYYNPYVEPSHDYVEIGGIKWATMNIGASSITDNGLYFQWADTQGYTAAQCGSGEGQKYFGWEDYKYGAGGSITDPANITKYNSTDGKTVLDAEDDSATAAWGGNWKIPTTDDFQNLLDSTNNSFVYNYNNSGVNGRLFVSKNDNSIELFFPANGQCKEGSVSLVDAYGRYWTNSLDTTYIPLAKRFAFGSNSLFVDGTDERKVGHSIRAILDE